MGLRFSALKTTVLAGILAASFETSATAQTVPATEVEEATLGLQAHPQMADDPGVYARDLYLAYIISPSDTVNLLSQAGLLTLAAQSFNRTSVEPAGVVALDIERDDLSLFPIIYWPVSENTPRLSSEARQKILNYTGSGGVIVIDLIGGTLRTSATMRQLLDDIQAAPLQIVEEGHILTQSLYLVETIPGISDRDVLVERTLPELESSNMTSFVIGDQNWAAAWTGRSVGPDVHENGLRSGLNILMAALMGTSKLDEMHQETLDQKREFQREFEARQAAESEPEPP